ncbi:zinc finger CCCH domain-containing protein 20-like [Magnolia sinica]|uniref:zinc finger CCCH domain-containing protein 20-like n=1 Tax=Magnolia sinica TaxID=86752 RepID=UPI00265B0516|nr:zinc finger CCCH domain-containing protein 20-like [Magnolia sinica]
MMLGEGIPNPTVHVPPWTVFEDSTAGMIFQSPVSGISVNTNGAACGGGDYSPFLIGETLSALQRYLPSNEFDDSDSEIPNHECDVPVDGFSCDEFRMYEFKVRRCARGRSHDWTECPYAHPGEKARRRDPRKFHYSGTACPDFRKGNCKRGDSCEFAHGVFECWLHPARYRTQPCKDGTSCRRRVCFFAHTPQQLRVLPQQSPRTTSIAAAADSYDGSPLRQAIEAGAYMPKSPFTSSPTSTLISPPHSPPSESPPLSPISPSIRRSMPSGSVNEVLASLRQLQLSKVKSAPASWGLQFGSSPRGPNLRPAFSSLPSTPTAPGAGIGWMDSWERGCIEEEPMERVESGRDLRAKMYEKLSKENSIEHVELPSAAAAPDVGWVSELVM